MDWTVEAGFRAGTNALHDRALDALQAATDIRIGHVDTGITAHPALGFTDGAAPETLLIDAGLNLVEPGQPPFAPPMASAALPRPRRIAQGRRDFANQFRAQPDHGTRTLSVLLGAERNRLAGIAPGARVIPVRIANGPVLTTPGHVQRLGRALDHLLSLDVPPRVILAPVGVPGILGVEDIFGWLTGGLALGLDARTAGQLDRAARMGVIVVTATGSIGERVLTPASHDATIAVGGIRAGRRKGLRVHCPEDGYSGDILARIDTLDLAEGWNRAVTVTGADGTVEHAHAAELDQPADDLLGTGQAAARVAGAAALWLALHREALALDTRPPGRWLVTAFRSALRRHAEPERIACTGGRLERRRVLDLAALLATAP